MSRNNFFTDKVKGNTYKYLGLDEELKNRVLKLEQEQIVKSKMVSSYEEMKNLAVGDSTISFIVLNDEDKNQLNTMYQYFPEFGLMWIAAVKEEL